MSFSKEWKLVAGLRYDRYNAQLDQLDQPAARRRARPSTSPACAPGVIYQPTDAQSYYVSYGTSFNPSLETLTLTSGQQSLDPEKNKSVRARRQVGPAERQPVAHLRDVPDREDQRALADLARACSSSPATSACAASRSARPGASRRNWQVLGGLHATSTRRSSRPRRSTARRARCPPTRRATAPRSGPTYNFTRDWEIGTGLTYMSPRFAANNDAVKVAGLRPLGRHGRLPPAQVRHPAQPAQPHQPAELRRADPFRPRPLGAGIDRTALLTYTHRF